jgi:hypothetical protein
MVNSETQWQTKPLLICIVHNVVNPNYSIFRWHLKFRQGIYIINKPYHLIFIKFLVNYLIITINDCYTHNIPFTLFIPINLSNVITLFYYDKL